MDAESKRRILDIHLAEYQKDEQIARIGFRDNLIYVMLAVFGAIVSFAITEPLRYPSLLVLPLVSLVLGWTYLVNDEKVSAIGRYIRHDLCDRMTSLTADEGSLLFGWEIAHRDDAGRTVRKRWQCAVDEVTFVGSGAVGLGTYVFLTTNPTGPG